MTIDLSEWPLELFRTMLDYIVTAQCQASDDCQISESLSVRANIRKVARLRLVSRLFNSEITRALAFQINANHDYKEYDWNRNRRLLVETLFRYICRTPRYTNDLTAIFAAVLDFISARAVCSSIKLSLREDCDAVMYGLCEAIVVFLDQPSHLLRIMSDDSPDDCTFNTISNWPYHISLVAAVASLGDEALMRTFFDQYAFSEEDHLECDELSLTFGYPMSAAARAGREAMVRMLLQQGATSGKWEMWRQTPLEAAAAGGFGEMIEAFATEHWAACIPPANNDGMKAWRRLLMRAVEGGNAGIVERFIVMMSRRDILYREPDWRLPFDGNWFRFDKGPERFDIEKLKKETLLEAARSGRLQIVRYLLELGVYVDTRDGKSRTPLVLAAAPGFYDCVKLLLEHGASIKKCNMLYSGGLLGMAVEKHHTGIVRLLLEKGALDPKWRLPEDGKADLKLKWRGNSCDHSPLMTWMARRGIWKYWQEVARLASEVYGLDPNCECLRRYDENGVMVTAVSIS